MKLYSRLVINGVLILTFIPITRKILRTNQGLDFSDEGLYLLAANPSERYQSWGFPFGWNTAPLLNLVGSDISKLRILSAVILMISVFFLSKIMFQDCFEKDKKNSLSEFFIPYFVALSSLYFYVGYVRIPGYNWLNIVGIVISLIGYKLALKNYINSIGKFAAIFTISTGFLISIPGKPSSAAFLFCAFILLIYFFHKEINHVKFIFSILSSLVGSILILVVFKVWPNNFLDYFLVALNFPKLAASATPLEAVKQTLLTPIIIPFYFSSNLRAIQFLYLSLLAIISFSIIKYKEKVNFLLAASYCILSILILDINGFNLGVQGFKVVDSVRIDKPELYISFLILLLFISVNLYTHFFSLLCKKNWAVSESIFLLLSASVIFGFGSTISSTGKGSSVVFLVLLAIFLVVFSSSPQNFTAKMTVIFVVALNSILLVLFMNPNISKPYRIEDFSKQSSELRLPRHANVLSVDSESKNLVVNLRNTLTAHNYDQRYPLLDFSSSWQPGLFYLLEVGTPPSLLLTIPGYDGSYQVLKSNLKVASSTADLKQSWILVSSERNSKEERILNDSLTLLGDFTNSIFPNDYVLLFDRDGFQLWKPIAVSL